MATTAAEFKPRPRAAALPQAFKRVALVANEKGGVGKSVFTRTLVDYLRSKGKRVAAYDADGSVGATARVLGTRDASGAIERVQNPVEGIGYYNGRADDERNILLDSIESGEKLYVHDLAGGLLADLTRIVDGGEGLDGLLDAFEAHSYKLTVFHVISPDVGAAQSVARWLSLIGDKADHVAVINLKQGRPPVLASGLWRTRVDPNQLQSALLNLAVNARDAMPDGGKLTIETGNAYIDEDYARQHVEVRPGQYALIALTDSGTGMSPEVMSKVFDPFFTTKGPGKGTGLGLSQVFGFVKQSGGHIKIYSELDHGTTVKIYLPKHAGEGELAVPSRQSVAEPLQRGNPDILILVVEDDERMRGVAVEMVKELGYGVLVAENAAHALALTDEHPGVSLLFTDIVMPDMNGRALADEALRRRPGLQVIFTTGFTRNAVIHHGVLDAGVNFLAKPFSIEQLGKMIATVLRQAEKSD